ncbi:sulfatase [Aestuariivivens sediminicola]|nr:sulfatase [Aestuariivivens sediminicola]
MFIMLAVISAMAKAQEIAKPNVLFIVVDDLRPELGCYGKSQIISPHIDRLAASGMIFNRSYCNIPVCGASRASLLSGVRPNRYRFEDAHISQDKDLPGVVSLPMHFKNNGYYTISLGKVYHKNPDGVGSWSIPQWRPKGDWNGWQEYITPASLNQSVKTKWGINGPSFEAPDGSDHIYGDGMIADEAIRHLGNFKETGQRFFLAVGFRKPHLPFNVPKKYWDMYNIDNIQLPDNMYKPIGAPDISMHNFKELREYTDVPDEGSMEQDFMKKLIHGYYASVSYVDAQVGKVLNELEHSGLAQNTIVILWGDHGWNLGEHDLWVKHCNYDNVLRTPLILYVPGQKGNVKTDALVEYVDIYPTLCDLAGLSKPFHLQGKSFAPLVAEPDQSWKEAVFSRWKTGETIITQTYTYTEWFDDHTGERTDRMLYNLTTDPDENVNISEIKENKSLVKKLSAKLADHIKQRDFIQIKN